MSRWNEFRQAMKNPPEERLCLINANGYKIGILAIIVISIVLLQTVIWYISFIFLVQLVNNWVGYKREIKSYHSIIRAKKEMGIYQEIDEDPSFTRRRFRTNASAFGESSRYVILFLVSIPIAYFTDMINLGLLKRFGVLLLIIISFLWIYLYPTYWISKHWRKK